MKAKYLLLIPMLIFCLGMTSCVTYYKAKPYKTGHYKVKTNKKGKLPPGQVKKMTGSKSAARYAPGHNK